MSPEEKSESQLQQLFTGKSPVGLLEVERGMPATSLALGVQVGVPDNSQNAYCTALLLDTGAILTSAECLKNSGGKETPLDKLKLFLRDPLEARTKKFDITSISVVRDSPTENWAVLTVKNGSELVNTFGGITRRNSVPANENLRQGLSVSLVEVGRPNGRGEAKIQWRELKLNTGRAVQELEDKFLAASSNTNSISRTQKAARDADICAAVRFSGATQTAFLVNTALPRNSGAALFAGREWVGIVRVPNQFTLQKVSENRHEVRPGAPVAQWMPSTNPVQAELNCSPDPVLRVGPTEQHPMANGETQNPSDSNDENQ